MDHGQLETALSAAPGYIQAPDKEMQRIQTGSFESGEQGFTEPDGTYYRGVIDILIEKLRKMDQEKRKLHGDITRVVKVYEGNMIGTYNGDDLLHAVDLLAKKHATEAFKVTVQRKLWLNVDV